MGVPNEVVEHVLDSVVSIPVQVGRQRGFSALCSGSLEMKDP
jgi:hypothetical protein